MINSTITKKANKIKCLALDVDGVLTDGSIIINSDGQDIKHFNAQDGQGMKLLQNAGITVAIISARKSQAVIHRMKELGVTHIYLGQHNKIAALEDLLKQLNIKTDEVAYAGDDLPDLPVMQRIGLSIAVNNAIEEIKAIADWQTPHDGGKGAVRDICNLLLKANSIHHQ